MSPRVTIVIPAYNAPRTIVSTIRSVQGQSEKNWELIVVDDGSSDETPEVVEGLASGDPRITLHHQENAGTAGARNTGIRLAAAPVVSFVDNDDLWLPTYLVTMLAALDERPDAAVAYTDGWVLDDDRKRIRRASAMSLAQPPQEPAASREALLEQLARANFILSSATIKRPALQQVGGFDETVTGSDDYDLWVKLAAAGYGFVKPPGRLVIQRNRFDSQSKNKLPTYTRHHEVIRRIAEGPEIPERAREIARAQLERNERYLAGLTGSDRRLALAHRLRAAASRLRHSVAPPRTYRTPPREITEVFPDIREL